MVQKTPLIFTPIFIEPFRHNQKMRMTITAHAVQMSAKKASAALRKTVIRPALLLH